MICATCNRVNPDDALTCASCQSPISLWTNTFTEFQVWLLVVLHIITLGIFGIVWINLFHGKMTRIRPDDPTAGRAVGFLFIPFYGLYWLFFTHLRLCDRINELRRHYGLPGDVPKGLVIATCIVQVIPYVNTLSLFIFYPILAGIFQSKVNELARLRQQTSVLSETQVPFALPAGGEQVLCFTCGKENPAIALYCAFCGAAVQPAANEMGIDSR